MHFKDLILRQRNTYATIAAGCVVVMIKKLLAKFKPVLPAVWYTAYDAELLKQLHGPIDTCTVHMGACYNEFAHRKTTMVLQRVKHRLPWFGEALMGCAERILEYNLHLHAAIIHKIATHLQK